MVKSDYYLIMGFGRSGQAALNWLISSNKKAVVYDKNIDKIIKSAVFSTKNQQNNVKFVKKLQKRDIKNAKSVIISPSFSIFNKNVAYALSLGKKVISELEFGYLINSKPKYVAITGTNGKTTTTMLINQMLKTKYRCDAYGNIGKPLTEAAKENLDYIALEVSSFQLEAIDKFKPNIFAIINIDADHLDRHKTLENYILTKYKIFANCSSVDIGIINADDPVFEKYKLNTKAKLFYFSKTKEVEGAYLKNNNIYVDLNNKTMQIAKISDFCLPFNIIDDVLVAVLVAKLCKVSNKNIIAVLKSFVLAPYRAEAKIINGIKIINDSKGTNIHSAICALKGLKNVILLLGGEDKGLDFVPLFKQNLSDIKCIYCFGKTATKINKTAKRFNFKHIFQEKNCKTAVFNALSMAKEGDVVLFSPACSSFDEFSSYAERGKVFDEIVNKFFTNC